MKKENKAAKSETQTTDLRKQAEKIARKNNPPDNIEMMSPEERRILLHELRVHQVELEMQNEELQRTQEQLDTERALYFDLYDLAPVGYMSVSKQGLIIKANLTAATLLGVSRNTLSKALMTRFIIKEDQDIYYLHIKALFETGEQQKCELRMVKKDGSSFWAMLDATAAQDAEGENVCRIVISNITERKQIEEEIRKMNDELESRVRGRTDQLEDSNKALEAFSYSVSHDLRAPLRSIEGFSQAILEEYREKLDETGRNYLDRVCAAAKRMEQLINNTLKLSQVNRFDFQCEAVDLSRMVREITEAHQKSNPDRAVNVIIREGIIVQGDHQMMKIVLGHLLDNAFKFTGKQAQPRIEFDKTIKDNETAYYVRDNGAGFDMAYVDKLFGPFQRLHTAEEFAGTGIGLATVQRIIHRHGGQVWAEGETGKGSTLYFNLPS